MSIDALEITYGRAMGTAKYHRVVGVDGQAADVNAAGSSSIYIWYHRGDEAPIYQLEIIQADEPVPEGFVKLGKTVTKGTDARAFLCYSSAPTDSEESVLPMCRLLVAGADEPKLQEQGYERMLSPLSEGEDSQTFLWFQRGEPKAAAAVDEGPVFSLDDVQPGQWFDVYDSVDRWFVGKIVTKTDSEVTISYKNLSSIYNETFKRSETHRFAPLHTHTTKWTRQGEYWDVTDEELEAFTQKLQDYHSNVISDSRARSAFADVEVPEMTHRLLRSRYATVETQDAVFDCLKAVIQHCGDLLRTPGADHDKALQMLQQHVLCDSTCNFFIHNHGMVKRSLDDVDQYTGSAGRIPASASRFFVGFLNAINDSGVYDTIIDRMNEEGEQGLTVEQTAAAVHMVHGGRYCYTTTFFDSYMPRLLEAVSNKVLRMAVEDLKNVPPTVIDGFITDLNDVLSTAFAREHTSMDRSEAFRHIEALKFRLAARLLGCEFLGLRVKGLTILADLVVLVTGSGKTNYDYRSRTHLPAPTTEWLTPALFTQLLGEQEIIPLLVGATTQSGKRAPAHEEILKRCGPILQFALEHNAFQKSYLDHIWAAMQTTTVTGRRVLNELIESLLVTMPVELTAHLLDLLVAVSSSDIDVAYIELLQRVLAEHANKVLESNNNMDSIEDEPREALTDLAGEGVRQRALSLLLECAIQRTVRRGVDVWKNARDALLQLVDSLEPASQNAVAIGICARCLQRAADAPALSAERATAVSVMKRVLNALPARHFETTPEAHTRDGLLNNPLNGAPLHNQLVQELIAFQAAVLKPGTLKTKAGGDVLDEMLPGDISYKVHLETRFSTLVEVLQGGQPQLSWDQLNALWQAFVGRSCPSTVSDYFFRFVKRLHSTFVPREQQAARQVLQSEVQPTQPFESSVLERMFTEKLLVDAQFPAAKMLLNGFKLFKTVFLACENNLAADTNTAPGSLKLWEFVEQIEDAETQEACCTFVSKLYLETTSPDELTEGIRNVVDRCMEGIRVNVEAVKAEADSASGSAAAEDVVGRFASMLRKFVQLAGEMGEGGSQGVRVEVTEVGSTKIVDQFKANVDDGLSFRGLRALIADRLRVPASHIRILSSMSRLPVSAARQDTHEVLTQLYSRVNAVISAMVLPAPAADTRDHEPLSTEELTALRGPWALPKQLISSNPDYFATLLSALTLKKSAVVRSLWLLLDSLPLNAATSASVTTLCGALTADTVTEPAKSDVSVDWHSVLDPKAPIRLLYSLQIVNKVLDVGTTVEGADGEAVEVSDREWMVFFLLKGGFEHLLEIVSSMDTELMFSSPLYKQCVSNVFRLLSKFLSLVQASEAEADDGADADADAAGVAVAPDEDATGAGAGEHMEAASTDEEDESGSAKDDKAKEAAAAAATPDQVLPAELRERIAASMKMDATSIAHVFDVTLHLFRHAAQPRTGQDVTSDPQPKVERKRANNTSTGISSMMNLDDLDDDLTKNPTAAAAGAGASAGEDPADGADEATQEANKTQTALLSSMLETIGLILELRPQLLPTLASVKDIGVIITEGVLQAPTPKMRALVQDAVDTVVQISARKFTSEDGTMADEAFLVRNVLLKGVLDALDGIYKYHNTCSSYFKLLSQLLSGKLWRQSGGGSDPDKICEGVSATELFHTVAKAVVLHPFIEIGATEKDHMLGGFLRALHMLVEQRVELHALAREEIDLGEGQGSATLLHGLFHDCLFSAPSAQDEARLEASPPKCKHKDTRDAAFGLLSELAAHDSVNSTKLARLAHEHNLSIEAEGQAAADENDTKSRYRYRDDAPRSAAGYVGLLNLGCICYMNSSLQQFFMIPEFRRCVLAFDEYDDDFVKEDSPMYQLQRMFAYLQESEREDFNPEGLCMSLKDWDGNPIDTRIQRDTSEFLSQMFQAIETAVQGTEHENMLRDVFGGTVSNELIAEGQYRARDEPFQFLSVQVQEMKNLESALHHYISGEVIDDYKWDKEDGSEPVALPTTKRVSIKTLPEHLIIHLKRFEFDMVRFVNVKVNDLFEFPMRLNMKKFTLHGRQDHVVPPPSEPDALDADAEPGMEAPAAAEASADAVEEEDDDLAYEYQLMGCVIHLGTCEAGHYYSYICGRDGEGRPMNKWFEFNDSWVSEFDAKRLESETFGGKESYRYYDYMNRRYVQGARERSQNAFLLFYDKVKRGGSSASDVSASQTIEVERREDLVRWIQSKRAALQAIQANRCPVPKPLYDEVWKDNETFWRRRNIMNSEYFTFVQSLISASAARVEAGRTDSDTLVVTPETARYPIDRAGQPLAAFVAEPTDDTELTVVSLALSFVSGGVKSTTIQAQQKKQYTQLMKTLLSHNAPGCIHVLNFVLRNPAMLKSILLPRGYNPLKSPLLPVLQTAIATLASCEELCVVAPGQEPVIGQLVSCIAADMVNMLADVPSDRWSGCHYLISTLLKLAQSGPAGAQLLLEHNVLARLIDLIVFNKSPHPDLNGPLQSASYVRSKHIYDKPKWTDAFALIGTLIRYRQPASVTAGGPPSPHQLQPEAPLTPVEADMLSFPAFVQNILKHTFPGKGRAVAHLLWNDTEITAEIAATIKADIVTGRDAAVATPFTLIMNMAAEEDDGQAARVDVLLTAALAAMQSQAKYFKETELAIAALVETATSRAIFQWLHEHWESWQWCLRWLLENEKPPVVGSAIVGSKPMAGYSYSHTTYVRSVRPAHLLLNIQRIVNGRFGLYLDNFDASKHSDWLVGKRVLICFKDGSWRPALVKEQRPGVYREPEHLIVYDDSTLPDIWFTMSGRIWKYETPSEALFPVKEGDDGPPVELPVQEESEEEEEDVNGDGEAANADSEDEFADPNQESREDPNEDSTESDSDSDSMAAMG